jgi:hypothetical protein
MIQEIESIIKKHLPKFWSSVYEHTFWGDTGVVIKIAAKDFLINGVQGQRPQAVSLFLNMKTLELQPQSYGCTGGRVIYRQPNMNDPKEQFLAMKSVKIPFRTPNKDKESVLKAIEKFCINYKKALAENYSVLRYHDIVNYDDILN